MNLLDKIVLNRLISIVTTFIVGVLKIISPKTVDPPKPKPKRKILPWRNNE